MEISLAKNQDIDAWMNLVYKVKENFPGLETEDALNEHRSTVLAFIHELYHIQLDISSSFTKKTTPVCAVLP